MKRRAMGLKKRVSFGLILFFLSLAGFSDGFITTTRLATAPSRHLKERTTTHPQRLATARHSKERFQKTRMNAVPMAAGTLASPLGAVGILLFVILIHECGHYSAAKLFGMKVQEFSVGLGPKVSTLEAFGDEFTFRALPLGGYVSFPLNYNETEARIVNDKVTLRDARNLPSWERTLYNILSLGTYQTVVDDLEKREERMKKKKEPSKWWNPFAKAKQEEDDEDAYKIKYSEDPDLLQNRPWPQRAVVIAGGVVFNLLLAFTLYFGQISLSNGITKPLFAPGAAIERIVRVDSPAAGILNKGDVIVGINGSPLSVTQNAKNKQKLDPLQVEDTISEVITKIRATPEGESLLVSVVKAGSDPQATTPRVVTVKPRVDKTSGFQTIGTVLGPNVVGKEVIRSDSPITSARLAAENVASVSGYTATGVLRLISTFVVSGGDAGPAGEQVSGPIGMIQTGSKIVSSSNYNVIASFLAGLSINLAVINALPLPALDGGQMVFVLWEAVTGKKVQQKLQETITSGAAVLLLLFAITTTLSDVKSLFGS